MFYVGVELIYNAVLISSIQSSDVVIQKSISFFSDSLSSRLHRVLIRGCCTKAHKLDGVTFFLIYFLIYLFMAILGLLAEWASLVAVHGLLTAVASLIAEHRL